MGIQAAKFGLYHRNNSSFSIYIKVVMKAGVSVTFSSFHETRPIKVAQFLQGLLEPTSLKHDYRRGGSRGRPGPSKVWVWPDHISCGTICPPTDSHAGGPTVYRLPAPVP
ncbi:hypothetical protein J6590_052171 [Homalodisca vitripennis]|nr:hypothetical protein J6590_052171 [Homalodisca vitripennis]